MVNLTGDYIASVDGLLTAEDIRVYLEKHGLQQHQYYILYNGKRMSENSTIHDQSNVRIVLRLFGGKGGFGSMLRAIGAQIEKTTNREACRDLSGRRLRDINEEKRLKNWIASQSDRDREAAEKRQKKLERLCAEPSHKFQDAKYEKIRSDLPEQICDAVEQGFKASAETAGNKRKTAPKPTQNAKKSKLWIDADLEDLSTSDDSDTEPSTSDDSKSAQSNAERNATPVLKVGNSMNIPEQDLVAASTSTDGFVQSEACVSVV